MELTGPRKRSRAPRSRRCRRRPTAQAARRAVVAAGGDDPSPEPFGSIRTKAAEPEVLGAIRQPTKVAVSWVGRLPHLIVHEQAQALRRRSLTPTLPVPRHFVHAATSAHLHTDAPTAPCSRMHTSRTYRLHASRSTFWQRFMKSQTAVVSSSQCSASVVQLTARVSSVAITPCRSWSPPASDEASCVMDLAEERSVSCSRARSRRERSVAGTCMGRLFGDTGCRS